jgi:RNA polymerase sigma-70 factor (ECF subfamily)
LTGTIEAIYRRHRQGLYTLALSIVGRPEAAEDAVHDAVVRLCRPGAPRPTGDAVAYVFAAVRNAAVDDRRRAGPRPAAAVSIFDLAEPAAGDRPADASIADAERDLRVADALGALAPEQREAVVLHLFAGLTFAQAAEAAGVPLQTLASRYRRGLAALREPLASLQ